MRDTYPRVLSESETISTLLMGYSIARFGDGELKIIDGEGYRREPKNEALTTALRDTFSMPAERCLIGIPTFDAEGPKVLHWRRHEKRFLRFLSPTRTYFSAFISRPDSAPWINTPEFAQRVQQLWLGKRVAVLCEAGGSALRAVKYGADSIEHIICPTHEAFEQIDSFERSIAAYKPDIAILSCGPTASILANRLCKRGLQAIDFGSGGSFIAKLLDQ